MESEPEVSEPIDIDAERNAVTTALRDAILRHSDDVSSLFAAACQRDLQKMVSRT